MRTPASAVGRPSAPTWPILKSSRPACGQHRKPAARSPKTTRAHGPPPRRSLTAAGRRRCPQTDLPSSTDAAVAPETHGRAGALPAGGLLAFRSARGGLRMVGDALGGRRHRRPGGRACGASRARPRRSGTAAATAGATMRSTEPTCDGALDAVDGVELGRQLAAASRSAPSPTAPPARRAGAGAPRRRRPRSARRAPRSAASCARAPVDVAGEDDRGGGRAADHRRVRALERDRLEVLVEALREDDERAAVVARDDAEDDRPVEVDDRPADLGAVLELQLAHRLGRAVEARRGWRARPAAGCPLAALIARAIFFDDRGNSVPAVHCVGAVGRDGAAARQRAATRCRSARPGQPPRWASQTTAVSASRMPAQRSSGAMVVVDRPRASPSGCRTASCGPGWSRRRRCRRRVARSRARRARAATARTSRSRGSVGRAPGAGSARPAPRRCARSGRAARRRRRRGRAPSTAPGRWGP